MEKTQLAAEMCPSGLRMNMHPFAYMAHRGGSEDKLEQCKKTSPPGTEGKQRRAKQMTLLFQNR
jgi:hypothetical protein